MNATGIFLLCVYVLLIMTTNAKLNGAKVQKVLRAAEQGSTSSGSAVNRTDPLKLVGGAEILGVVETIHPYDADPFKVEIFYELKYATAGRFKAPKQHTIVKKDNPIELKEYPSIRCKQFGAAFKKKGVEHCLFLDVYRPSEIPEGKKLPVMVYIHGGGLVVGSKHNYNFADGLKSFTVEDVIVVSINYRLNLYGLWTNPQNPYEDGLWGLKDQIMSLHWVQENIEAFGGDKGLVTIFGQSGGALSVTAIYASKKAKGLIHRAIAQSPGWQFPGQYQRDAKDVGKSLARKCARHICPIWPLSADYLSCMQNSLALELTCPLDTKGGDLGNPCCIYSRPAKFLTGQGESYRYLNGFDKNYITQGLYTATCNDEEPTGSDVPLLIGSNKYEWTFFDNQGSTHYSKAQFLDNFLREHIEGYGDAKADQKICVVHTLLDAYKDFGNQEQRLAQILTDTIFTIGPQLLSVVKGANKYRYVINTTGTGAFETDAGKDSAHGDELCYFHDKDMTHWKNKDGYPGEYHINPNSHSEPEKHAACEAGADPKAGKMLREYWTSFARDGVPSSELAQEMEIDTWVPVQKKTTSGNMLGLPFMNLDLSSTGETSSMEDQVPWSTLESAKLLSDIACNTMKMGSFSCTHDPTLKDECGGQEATNWKCSTCTKSRTCDDFNDQYWYNCIDFGHQKNSNGLTAQDTCCGCQWTKAVPAVINS